MRHEDFIILQELKNKLSKVAELIDIRAFGSRARGDEDEYSDLDVFVEVDTLNKAIKDRILNIIWETSYNHSLLVSPLICSKEEIENSPLRSSPIIKNILREGIKA